MFPGLVNYHYVSQQYGIPLVMNYVTKSGSNKYKLGYSLCGKLLTVNYLTKLVSPNKKLSIVDVRNYLP